MSAGKFALDTSTIRQIYCMMLGDYIGCGAHRHVYKHGYDDTLVVKLECKVGSFQNVIEWETWQSVQSTDLAKWFAPCVAISANGEVLVQRRTTPATKYPDKIPAFFTDTKLGNYGVLVPRTGDPEEQFVCHDYGLHLMLEKGMTKRMKNAHWWNF